MDNKMDMSLDDYIASFKKNKEMGTASTGNLNNNEHKFKAERRIRSDDNDEEEFEADSNIWRGPDAGTNFLDLEYMQDDFEKMFNDPDLKKSPVTKNQTEKFQNEMQLQHKSYFDLRDKISGSPVPNSNSQQWRLMQPNVMSQRPAGMPPLVPQNSMQDRQMQQRSNRCNRRGNWTNNNNNGRRWGNQRNSNQQYCNGNLNTTGFSNNNNMINSGRVQRFNQRNNQELLNKNVKAVIERLNRSNGHVLPQDIRDLTIEIPSASINATGNSYPRNTSGGLPPRATITMNPLQPAAQNLLDSSSNRFQANDSIRTLLGVNDTNAFKTEMMPMLATKFLDFLQNGAQQTMHKPIYDMKLQKEIHEIQKKPLMYKCSGGGGGEVVSSDGSGISNCEVIPRTSGISLNNRFA